MLGADRVETIRAAHALSEHRAERPARAPAPQDWSTCVPPLHFPGAELLPATARHRNISVADTLAGRCPQAPIDIGTIALRTLGVTVERRRGSSRWFCHANPSSGNLHPTELYVLDGRDVLHFAAREGAFARIGRLEDEAPTTFVLTQIAERQCWKYGDRGVRYAELDLGHAVAGLRLAAASHGHELRPIDGLFLRDVLGLDGREGETIGAAFTTGALDAITVEHLLPASKLRGFDWPGARSTARAIERAPFTTSRGHAPSVRIDGDFDAVVTARRSAAAFADAPISRDTFDRLLESTLGGSAFLGAASVDLLLFVHRVEGLTPGAYLFRRSDADHSNAFDPDFGYTPVGPRLYRLDEDDVRAHARAVHVDQAVASDGAFCLTMLAPLDETLATEGAGAYRRLHLEAGAIGHVLYLGATALGLGATGIGAFYDVALKQMLGTELTPLYGFAVGAT
ncbi:MAG: nitroreductase family protein [Deltaproteobacteria bacterium]|jgi:nitroreductase